MFAESPEKVAVEVPMVHGGLYAPADALIPEAGRYVLQETKASPLPLKSDKVTPDVPEEHQLNDVAIQAWAMEGTDILVGRIDLNFLNNQWRYPGNGDYSGLFRKLDVTAEAQIRNSNVPTWIAQAQAILGGEMPQLVTGKQFSAPYQCPFESYCKNLDPPGPEHPIELLPDSPGNALAKSYEQRRVPTFILFDSDSD